LAVPNRKAGRQGNCPNCRAPITVPELITFACPGCGATLGVVDYKAGRKGTCPNCGAGISAPSPAEAPTGVEALEIRKESPLEAARPRTPAIEAAVAGLVPVGAAVRSQRPAGPAHREAQSGVLTPRTTIGADSPPAGAGEPAFGSDGAAGSPGRGRPAAPPEPDRPAVPFDLPGRPQTSTGQPRPAAAADPGDDDLAPASEEGQQKRVKVSVPAWQPDRRTSGLGVAALVLGILAALPCWKPGVNVIGMPLGALGVLLGIAAIIAAVVGKRRRLGMPIAGVAVSGAALVAGIAVNLVFAAEVGETAFSISSAMERIGLLGDPGPAQPQGQQAPPVAGAYIGVEYVGQRETDVGTQLRFRLTNNTGRAIKAFRGGILIYDQSGTQIDGLEAVCDQALDAGASMERSGVWPTVASDTLERLRTSPAEIELRFLVGQIIYADGTREIDD
jgi:hypothetical protein